MATSDKSMGYNDPLGGAPSSIGSQIRTDFFKRRALIELAKEQYFQPQADVTAMPKHYGKKIKQYLYIPMLDDRNVNDMGIDASGATIANGNLYGSSKDIGTISGKLPTLGEEGGRVNRVGFTRVEIEGEIHKMGIFTDYTKDSLQFDSDAELEMHVHREMLRGANEITEDVLQMDLLAGAGVIRYTGDATQNSELTGEGTPTVLTYTDLMRLAIDLDDNRTPKQTTLISGSKMTDTKVVAGGRFIYCGSEMIPTLERMVDLHGNPAFTHVEHYAAAGNIQRGEIGKIGAFRFIVVPEMQNWAGVGATATGSNEGYRESAGKYDVFPLLVIGEGSFTTIGFQTGGKTFKFEIFHKKPGREMADLTNPYGEKGFMSIKWWYGTMILRSERLAVIKTVAEI